jgi:hypothetical protein
MIAQALDLFIVLASVAAWLIALAFALRYCRRTRRQRVGIAWLLMLLAVPFRLADQVLYRANEQGRNRVVLGQTAEKKQIGATHQRTRS